jgi:uncharacterized membrane protein YdcZ (DUF606 family)
VAVLAGAGIAWQQAVNGVLAVGVAAAIVPITGVLVLGLAAVAGQLVGALLLDLSCRPDQVRSRSPRSSARR